MSKLSERLKEFVEERKKKLIEIEEETGIFHSNLSEFLSGVHTPSYDNFIKLVEYFHCSADYLLGLDEIHTEEPLHEILPFGERLREVMKQQKVSQAQMIRDMRLSSSLPYKWLHGIYLPSVSRLMDIAKYLDCSVDYLIGRRR